MARPSGSAASSRSRDLRDVKTRSLGFRTLPKHAAAPAAPADRNLSELDLLVRRIRAEFHEMPGLSLTVKQGARLFGVSEEVCAQILSALIGDGFLQCTTDGRYARAAVGH